MNPQRTWLVSVLAAAGITASGAVVAVATSDGRTDGVAASPPADRTITIATSSWRPGDGALLARSTGVLRATPDGCPYLAPRDPRSPATDRTPVIWPAGFTARYTQNGKVEILAPNGSVIAREGDYLSVDGGLLPSRGRPCTFGATNAFVIMDDLTR